MTLFDGFFTLSHEVKLYVPSTQGLAEPITRAQHDKRAKEICIKFTGLFGGATASRGLGYYKADSGEYIGEPVEIVTSGCTADALEENAQELLNFALEKAREWAQESLLVEIDGQKHFITV